VYMINGRPDNLENWTILSQAFNTITTSRQSLHWWGEDSDGDVIGYRFRWNSDSDWIYTSREDSTFYVPIAKDLDVFSFEIAAIDNDSLIDDSPAHLTVPVKNSRPSIFFRARSLPKLVNMPGDTNYTFPTRTFSWDIDDLDGRESVIDVFYALDDSCDTCWERLDAQAYSELTLSGLSEGFHTFFLKTRDIAGSVSNVVHFPDTSINDEPDFWKVKSAVGNILLVDDFPQDTKNNAIKWLASEVDSLVGEDGYSIWEPGLKLPFSTVEVVANLAYFDQVFWLSAYTGQEVYGDASASLYKYVLEGGNVFMSVAELKDTSFVWFPMDSVYTINKNYYQLSPGRTLVSQVEGAPDLKTPPEQGIYVRLSAFENHESDVYKNLYKLEEPADMFDEWTGTPTVAGIYQPTYPAGAGMSVFLTLPLHNGYDPLLNGNGTFPEFLSFLLEKFAE